MTARPFVTCVVATAGRASVRAAVADALAQVGNVAVEVLILDDAPETQCAGLDADPRVRWHRHAPLALPAKKRRATELARGEYLAVFDDDDRSAPGRLAFQLDRLRQCRTVGHLFAGCMVYEDTNGARWRRLGTKLHRYDASMLLHRDVARAFAVPDMWPTGHWLIAEVARAHGANAWTVDTNGEEHMRLGLNPENRYRYALAPPGWEQLP